MLRLLRPSNGGCLNVQKHLVSVLIVEWRYPDHHFISRYLKQKNLTLGYLGPTSLKCGHGLSPITSPEIRIPGCHRKNSTLLLISPTRNPPNEYNHAHLREYFLVLGLDRGSNFYVNTRGQLLFGHHKISLYPLKSVVLA